MKNITQHTVNLVDANITVTGKDGKDFLLSCKFDVPTKALLVPLVDEYCRLMSYTGRLQLLREKGLLKYQHHVLYHNILTNEVMTLNEVVSSLN